MDKTSIGDRMKSNYEDRYRFKLTRRTPVILRLDGKAFHTLTRSCKKPFDDTFTEVMQVTTKCLISEIQGAKCAYTQSDEISILLTDFDKLNTDAWFDYNLQKIVSISASIASVLFSGLFKKIGLFDCRAFNIPKEEVNNYFIWRQQDWSRNSIQMLLQTHYSPKELHNKNISDMHEMLYAKGINWAELDSVWKNGSFIYPIDKSIVVENNLIFTKNNTFIDQFMEVNSMKGGDIL